MVMKLVYFNVRGLAETSRILLALGGEEYEDFRYPLEVIDMSKHEMKKDYLILTYSSCCLFP